MSTKESTIDFILDQITFRERMSARKMFGEYALYCDGKVIGLVCDDTLFLKKTEKGMRFMGNKFEPGFAYPGAKESMKIDGDLIERREWFNELINITAKNLPRPKVKKKMH